MQLKTPKGSVLDDAVFCYRDTKDQRQRATLPGLMEALSRDEVADLPGVRAHQRHTVHMFLAQLASLCGPGFGKTAAEWREDMAALGPDEAAWDIFPAFGDHGFLQPAMRGEAKDPTLCRSLSDIDLLLLSTNHAVKREPVGLTDLDAWLWALVTLQTGAGFGGQMNYGGFRMAGGFSTRCSWAVYDRSWGLGARILNDALLIESRNAEVAEAHGFASTGGLALMWVADWPEGQMLTPGDVDPAVLEVCRRINLQITDDGQVQALLRTSAKPRTAMAASKDELYMRGVCGDIFSPVVTRQDGSTAFRMSATGLPYNIIADAGMGSSSDERVMTPSPASQRVVDDPVLVVAGIATASDKMRTEGFFRREVIFGKAASDAGPFSLPTLGETAQAMVAEARRAVGALRFAIRIYMDLGATQRMPAPIEARTVGRLDARIDQVFFEMLMSCHAETPGARTEWVRVLHDLGRDHLEQAFQEIAVRQVHQMRQIANAISAFEGTFWSPNATPSFSACREEIMTPRTEAENV